MGQVYRDFKLTTLPGQPQVEGYEKLLTPDAKRRDTFELTISRTHIRFGMPAYNYWWIDSDVQDLGWDAGVVQFGHHSYTPEKDCRNIATEACGPNTWHWDNLEVNPSTPFTIIRADDRMVSGDNPGPMTFAQPAPQDAHLRFAAAGRDLEVSFDGGTIWEAAVEQQHDAHAQGTGQDTVVKSYWQPIPEGTDTVHFRGVRTGKFPWMVRDASIWAPEDESLEGKSDESPGSL